MLAPYDVRASNLVRLLDSAEQATSPDELRKVVEAAFDLETTSPAGLAPSQSTLVIEVATARLDALGL